MILRRAALAVVLATALASQAGAQPASKSFRDWIAGCDNLRGCMALSLPAEAADDSTHLKLARAGGAAAPVSLSLILNDETLRKPVSVTLALDGAPFPAAGRSFTTVNVDGDQAIVFAEVEITGLLAAARKATKLTARAGAKSYDISLSGSVAALLWVDEQQGRLDTTAALIRKGPGTTIPPLPALPVITAKATDGVPALDAKAKTTLTAALRAHLKRTEPDSCDERPDGAATSDEVWPLGPSLRLVSLVCSLGAYNVSSGFWTVSGSDVAKAQKVLFPQLDGKPDNMLVNADYDPKTGQFHFYAKARGLGDCGTLGGYAWTGSGFVMTALSEMGECRGLTEDWLVLYRSNVKVAR